MNSMLTKIHELKNETDKEYLRSSQIRMNELDLRRLHEDFMDTGDMIFITPKEKTNWKDLIGGRLLGMLLVFDPDIDEMTIDTYYADMRGR